MQSSRTASDGTRGQNRCEPFLIAEAERAYTHRSALAHGQKLGQLSEPDRQLYESMETTLRLAILRAIEDDVFATMLNDPEEITLLTNTLFVCGPQSLFSRITEFLFGC